MLQQRQLPQGRGVGVALLGVFGFWCINSLRHDLLLVLQHAAQFRRRSRRVASRYLASAGEERNGRLGRAVKRRRRQALDEPRKSFGRKFTPLEEGVVETLDCGLDRSISSPHNGRRAADGARRLDTFDAQPWEDSVQRNEIFLWVHGQCIASRTSQCLERTEHAVNGRV